MREYFELLKDWCNGLKKYQITQFDDKGLKGALMCPACSIVHGRCHSAAFPLLYVGEKTKDKSYIECAINLIDWAEHMLCADGSFINDTICQWKGTTVFSIIAMLEAVSYDKLLPAETIKQLNDRIEKSLLYVYNDFKVDSGNINYLAGALCALELGGVYLNNNSYRKKAAQYAKYMLGYVSENNLIFGEGETSWDKLSPKKCSPIDIGYNVEETINLLVQYAMSANDENMLTTCKEIAVAHANFLLPDGGWDNSFGTRMDKWTYWGSRTSDGCQPAYIALSKYVPDLINVANKNLELLQKCTHDGLLFGGKDLLKVNEPPCIHHTITHSIGLATALKLAENKQTEKEISAKDVFRYKTKYYKELDTYVYNNNNWRATITGYDSGNKKWCHPTGGALSLLYHKKAGLIFTSSMSKYERYEIMNTQRHLNCQDNALTPRIQYGCKTMQYANILDKSAKIVNIDDGIYKCTGCFTNDSGEYPHGKQYKINTEYIFTENDVTISFCHDCENSYVILPVIVDKLEKVKIEGTKAYMYKNNCIVKIVSNQNIESMEDKLWFNHVPGFQAFPLVINKARRDLLIKIEVENATGI